MILERLVVGRMMANCYLIGDEDSREIAVVDPGANGKELIEYIEKKQYKPVKILLTHAHGDHIGGLTDIKKEYGIPVYIHNLDADTLADPRRNMTQRMFGTGFEIIAENKFQDGDLIQVGSLTIKAIHTPGHSQGSSCFLCKDVLLSGDTLFNMSIGRTDFGGGSLDQILEGIKNKLFTLDDNTKVYPGHNSPTTIGFEKQHNPFFSRND